MSTFSDEFSEDFSEDFSDPTDFAVTTVKGGKGKGGKKEKNVYSGKGIRAKEANIVRGTVCTIAGGGAKVTASTGKK
jgi:hypothetical protein